MQALETFLDDILKEPLAAARKADKPVGYVGLDLPLEIRFASSQQFCHLPWNKEQATPDADKWLESSFPGWARSMVEDWIAGRFDLFESVIFTRGDDASQRLYYYLCELRNRGVTKGPEPVIFDVATIPRKTSVNHCINAINRLMHTLGLTSADLEQGITRANEYRQCFAGLRSQRTAPGQLIENIARADLFCDLLPDLSAFDLPESNNDRGLVLAGSIPPDDSFQQAAEACGWNIVGEVNQRSLSRYGAPIEVGADDPVTMIARRINDNPYGPRAFADRSARLLAEVESSGAEAVVLWLTEDDEAQAWHVASQRAALADRNIPALVMTRRRWDGQDDSIKHMTEFLQELSV